VGLFSDPLGKVFWKFATMPTISNMSFNVRFNLTGTPTLEITDTTTSAPTGFLAYVSITQPDGYTRTGTITDITAAGGTFSTSLRLSSDGSIQRGEYIIKMTGNAPGYLSTDFTRVFSMSYKAPTVSIRQDFDVFTPVLKATDITDYSQLEYTNGTISKVWSAVSTPTGTLTGSGDFIDLAFSGSYWDAYYTITLTSSAVYTHLTYSWLTVAETVFSTISTYAQTPPSALEIIA
jgi:hypothetical protein